MEERYFLREEIVELFDCDAEFLDQLEAEELVSPVRVDPQSPTAFPPDQVERIRVITNLVRDLDVNLPGCEVILRMRENMIRMQEQFDRILGALAEEFKARSR